MSSARAAGRRRSSHSAPRLPAAGARAARSGTRGVPRKINAHRPLLAGRGSKPTPGKRRCKQRGRQTPPLPIEGGGDGDNIFFLSVSGGNIITGGGDGGSTLLLYIIGDNTNTISAKMTAAAPCSSPTPETQTPAEQAIAQGHAVGAMRTTEKLTRDNKGAPFLNASTFMDREEIGDTFDLAPYERVREK